MRIEIVQKIIDKLIKKKEEFNQSNYPIRLTENERKYLLENLKNSKRYLEYGSGGSTFLSTTETQIPVIVSVESDNGWIEYLRNWSVIKENEESQRLKFIYANIGKTGDWGIPLEPEKKDLFPNYSSVPFCNNEQYDTIFIDGRFRVACALQAILNSDLDTKIIMHDYNIRSEYHCILEFLNIVDIIDTMALFKIKENIDKDKLTKMYEEYKYNYS